MLRITGLLDYYEYCHVPHGLSNFDRYPSSPIIEHRASSIGHRALSIEASSLEHRAVDRAQAVLPLPLVSASVSVSVSASASASGLLLLPSSLPLVVTVVVD